MLLLKLITFYFILHKRKTINQIIMKRYLLIKTVFQIQSDVILSSYNVSINSGNTDYPQHHMPIIIFCIFVQTEGEGTAHFFSLDSEYEKHFLPDN